MAQVPRTQSRVDALFIVEEDIPWEERAPRVSPQKNFRQTMDEHDPPEVFGAQPSCCET